MEMLYPISRWARATTLPCFKIKCHPLRRRDQLMQCLLHVVNLYHFVIFPVVFICVTVPILEAHSKNMHIVQLKIISLVLFHQLFSIPLICASNIPVKGRDLPLLSSRYPTPLPPGSVPCARTRC